MTKLIWLDMEMTGLNVDNEVPIEVAAIITDFDFNERETFHAVIRQPQEVLVRMDDWNKKHHQASGLTSLVPSGTPPEEVDRQLAMLVSRHFSEPAILAGNSISQDRLFINRYLPLFAAKLHYRMLDVTAWKIVMQGKFNKKFEKQNNHRAIDDIRASIAEIKFYLSYVSVN